jgi:uncharacterized membrane protein
VLLLAVTMLLAGVVLLVLAARQRSGGLRRNGLVGLRTSATMRSDEAWHAAHAATAGLTALAGVVQVVAGGAIVVLDPGDAGLLAWTLGGAGSTLALVLTAAVRGHRIAVRVDRNADRDLD